jgi:hypothetical protein
MAESETQIQTLQLILRHLKGIVSALEKYLEQLKNEAVR